MMFTFAVWGLTTSIAFFASSLGPKSLEGALIRSRTRWIEDVNCLISSILISSFILLAVLTFSITCLDTVTGVFTSLLIISDFFSFSAKTVSLILKFDLSTGEFICSNKFSSFLISEFILSF